MSIFSAICLSNSEKTSFSEHFRKQLLQSKYLVLFLRLSTDNLEAAGFTELSHHLPADSAGIAPDCLALSSDNGDRGKSPAHPQIPL